MKRPAGRPTLEHPEPILDTPKSIASAVLNTKLKKRGKWRFEQKADKK